MGTDSKLLKVESCTRQVVLFLGFRFVSLIKLKIDVFPCPFVVSLIGVADASAYFNPSRAVKALEDSL
jgi:hypothetical protein